MKKKNGGKESVPEEDLVQFVKAGYSHFWVYTLEPRRAERKIQQVLREYVTKKGEQFETMIWDITGDTSAVECVQNFGKLPRMKALIARNFNMFLSEQDPDSPEIIQHILNAVEMCQSNEGRKLFFCISLEKNIPSGLERDFLSWTFDLPNEQELGEALNFICESARIPLLTGKERSAVIMAAKGMTYDEATNAFALSNVRSGKMLPANVSKLRASMIEKQNALKVIKYEETLDDLIGLDGIVSFALKTMESPLSKGVILIGPTGTGKSHLWKGISNAVNKLMITFSFAQIYQKYYGESEKAINAIIAILLAIGDCIILCDEYEKAFAGAGGRGSTTADVEQRATGEWLKFMQDRPDGIYIAATCNDISKLPPEHLRSERWDAIFYVPMPSAEALEKMMKHYKAEYSVNGTNPDMHGWTGSDVKTCCRLAKMMHVSVKEAGDFVTPTSKVKSEEIAALEAEAKVRGYNRADKLPEKTIAKAKHMTRSLDV